MTAARGRCRLAAVLGAAALALGIAVPAALAAGGRLETPGNPNNLPSWSFRNYRNEGGRGPNLTDHKPVLVSCRVQGAKVADGDVWWYRISASPWNGHYYVSADDFYNDGRRTGSLKGTPFFDPQVPVC